jgi:methionyl aminopeptidase
MKPYPISGARRVPGAIERPVYLGLADEPEFTGSHVQPPEIVEAMREPSRIAAQAIQVAAAELAPGVTTDRLDQVAHEFMCDMGAYPSTLGYRGFPKSICTSVNEVVCHGIPDFRPLEDGDLIKIDVTAYKNGVHGDNCATFPVGEVDQASHDLMVRTKEAMERGIKAVKPGRRLNVIGRVIQAYAGRFGYGVVRDYTGHGVHRWFHSGLIVLHYDEPSLTTVMEPGMTFTIEPMLTLGDHRSHVWADDWTVVTNDFSRVAQWEETLVVTDDGAEVLTVP